MSRNSQSARSVARPPASADAVLEMLRMPALIDSQSMLAWRAIMAIRLVAACSRAGHDPLTLLADRLASIAAATAMLELVDVLGRYWPESFAVMPPCCRMLSHDELTLGLLADAAIAGQRDDFGRILAGLIRADRHDRLFEQTKVSAAMLA